MKRSYNKPTSRILTAFWPGHAPNVVGSMAKRGSYWPTDFDQFQRVPVLSIEEAIKVMRVAILALSEIPDARVTEVKWSDAKWRPHAFLRASLKTLADSFQGGMCKIDAIAWLPTRYTEFSCVYEFVDGERSLNPQPSHEESLLEDFKDFRGEGKYFKAAKRVAALLRAQGKSTRVFDNFFRGDYGLLYSVLCDLTTLDGLSHLPPRRVRAELDSLIQRLGGVRLRDKSIQYIIDDLLDGDFAPTLKTLSNLVNNGAEVLLKVHSLRK